MRGLLPLCVFVCLLACLLKSDAFLVAKTTKCRDGEVDTNDAKYYIVTKFQDKLRKLKIPSSMDIDYRDVSSARSAWTSTAWCTGGDLAVIFVDIHNLWKNIDKATIGSPLLWAYFDNVTEICGDHGVVDNDYMGLADSCGKLKVLHEKLQSSKTELQLLDCDSIVDTYKDANSIAKDLLSTSEYNKVRSSFLKLMTETRKTKDFRTTDYCMDPDNTGTAGSVAAALRQLDDYALVNQLSTEETFGRMQTLLADLDGLLSQSSTATGLVDDIISNLPGDATADTGGEAVTDAATEATEAVTEATEAETEATTTPEPTTTPEATTTTEGTTTTTVDVLDIIVGRI